MPTETQFVYINSSLPRWLALADAHVEMANRFISDAPGQAAFHFHQAVERYLKAFLVGRGVTFDHQLTDIAALVDLCTLVPAGVPKLADTVAADTLSRWEAAYQYPPEAPQADPEFPTAKEFLAMSNVCKRLREVAVAAQ